MPISRLPIPPQALLVIAHTVYLIIVKSAILYLPYCEKLLRGRGEEESYYGEGKQVDDDKVMFKLLLDKDHLFQPLSAECVEWGDHKSAGG